MGWMGVNGVLDEVDVSSEGAAAELRNLIETRHEVVAVERMRAVAFRPIAFMNTPAL